MSAPRIAPGSTLPPLELPAISRLTLALYCGASGDHNPLHVDIDAARAAGLPTSSLTACCRMAYVGRHLTGLSLKPSSAACRWGSWP